MPDKDKLTAGQARKLCKYLEQLHDMVDNVCGDLRAIVDGLESAQAQIKKASRSPDDINADELAKSVAAGLRDCMPRTGINLGNFLLEVNARIANVPLLLNERVSEETKNEAEQS